MELEDTENITGLLNFSWDQAFSAASFITPCRDVTVEKDGYVTISVTLAGEEQARASARPADVRGKIIEDERQFVAQLYVSDKCDENVTRCCADVANAADCRCTALDPAGGCLPCPRGAAPDLLVHAFCQLV